MTKFNPNSPKNKAFSIMEISITILIIGILISGISASYNLVYEYKINIAKNTARNSIVSKTNDLVVWLDTTAEGAFDSNKDGASIVKWYNKSS